eukprot:476249-Prymnesium_polylepis.1
MPSLVESIVRGLLRGLSISVRNVHIRLVSGDELADGHSSLGLVVPSLAVGPPPAAAATASSWVNELFRKRLRTLQEKEVQLSVAIRGLSLYAQRDSVLAGASTAALVELDGPSWDILMLPTIEASTSAHAQALHPLRGAAPSEPSYVLLPFDATASTVLDLNGQQRGVPLLDVCAAAESPLAA